MPPSVKTMMMILLFEALCFSMSVPPFRRALPPSWRISVMKATPGFSPPPHRQCPRKTVSKPKSGEISAGDKGAASLMIPWMDRSGVAWRRRRRSDPFLRCPRPEFLPLSDSSYAENDATPPSDNGGGVALRLSSQDWIGFREMSVNNMKRLSPTG